MLVHTKTCVLSFGSQVNNNYVKELITIDTLEHEPYSNMSKRKAFSMRINFARTDINSESKLVRAY